jgi:hypothetical protein
MGGLVGGLADLFEGDPTSGQQKQLGSLGTFDTNVGEGLTTAGSTLEREILSGNPTELATALAPEIGTGQSQVEQQALQNAEFGTRSGGSTASTNAAESQNRANIINLEGGLQSSTAAAAVGQGSNLLNQASNDVSKQADLATQNRQRTISDIGNVAQGEASIAAPFLGGAAPAATQSLAPEQLTDLGPEMGPSPADFGSDFMGGNGPDLSVFNSAPPAVTPGW